MSLTFSAEVEVQQKFAVVRTFFRDPHTIARWDRSVSKVVITSPEPYGMGSTFSTIGPARNRRAGKRTDYRIVAQDEERSVVELLDSLVFESASVSMSFTPMDAATLVRCDVTMQLRRRYAALSWLLRLQRGALDDDLYFLQRALEHEEIAKR